MLLQSACSCSHCETRLELNKATVRYAEKEIVRVEFSSVGKESRRSTSSSSACCFKDVHVTTAKSTGAEKDGFRVSRND